MPRNESERDKVDPVTCVLLSCRSRSCDGVSLCARTATQYVGGSQQAAAACCLRHTMSRHPRNRESLAHCAPAKRGFPLSLSLSFAFFRLSLDASCDRVDKGRPPLSLTRSTHLLRLPACFTFIMSLLRLMGRARSQSLAGHSHHPLTQRLFESDNCCYTTSIVSLILSPSLRP